MEENNIEQIVNGLVKQIQQITYTGKSFRGEESVYHMISGTQEEKKQQVATLRNIIKAWTVENLSGLQTKQAMLEAKIYTYEQIIANSNFKATITKNKDTEEIKTSIAETNERLKSMDSNLVVAFQDLFQKIGRLEESKK